VIELVGQRTVPASQAEALLDPRWRGVLGDPEVWVMAPADDVWRPLRTGGGASYDSIALAWNLFGDVGRLSAVSAQHLFHRAEEFAQAIARRAIPMPPPEEVERQIARLEEVRENLDFGLTIMAVVPQPVPEAGLAGVCEGFGLVLSPEGEYEWRHPNHSAPLLGVSLLTDGVGFVPGSRRVHDGVALGFSIPLSPGPEQSLHGAFVIGEALVARLGAKLYDDEGEPLDDRARRALATLLEQARQTLTQAGFPPGSAEALHLFSRVGP
jgi:hypothetical protein